MNYKYSNVLIALGSTSVLQYFRRRFATELGESYKPKRIWPS